MNFQCVLIISFMIGLTACNSGSNSSSDSGRNQTRVMGMPQGLSTNHPVALQLLQNAWCDTYREAGSSPAVNVIERSEYRNDGLLNLQTRRYNQNNSSLISSQNQEINWGVDGEGRVHYQQKQAMDQIASFEVVFLAQAGLDCYYFKNTVLNGVTQPPLPSGSTPALKCKCQ